MIRAGQYDDVANELAASLASNTGKSETGFVIVLILINHGEP
jgi:hypothetical protein